MCIGICVDRRSAIPIRWAASGKPVVTPTDTTIATVEHSTHGVNAAGMMSQPFTSLSSSCDRLVHASPTQVPQLQDMSACACDYNASRSTSKPLPLPLRLRPNGLPDELKCERFNAEGFQTFHCPITALNWPNSVPSATVFRCAPAHPDRQHSSDHATILASR